MRRRTKIILAAIIPAAGLAYSLKPAQGTTFGQRVNAALDNALALATRVLELPTFFLLTAALAIAGLTAVAFHLRRQSAQPATRNKKILLTTAALFILLGLTLAADLKMQRLQSEVNSLRAQVANTKMNTSFGEPSSPGSVTPAISAPPAAETLTAKIANSPAPANTSSPAPSTPTTTAKRDRLLFNLDQTQQALASAFGTFHLKPLIVNNAIDAVQVQIQNPLTVGYLAIVDLESPGTEIILGTNLSNKTLTSAFAKTQNAQLAINGEAGNSPAMNSGLGPWTGYLVDHGKTLLTEQPNNPRPFLHFDNKNLATYRPQLAADRKLPQDPNTLIWGRSDALLTGIPQAPDDYNRQPRTAMGINKEGTKLFLFVVDGRQPQYSLGMAKYEVGQVMLAFGAQNAMLCDEGGSSTMYIQPLGGVLNSPSDGQERPTYTHFAIKTK